MRFEKSVALVIKNILNEWTRNKNFTCFSCVAWNFIPLNLLVRPRLDLGLPASFIHSWSKDGCSVIISSFIFIILSCRAPKVEKALYIYGQFGKNLLSCNFSNYQECLFLVEFPKKLLSLFATKKHLQHVKTVFYLGFDCVISGYNPYLDQEQFL